MCNRLPHFIAVPCLYPGLVPWRLSLEGRGAHLRQSLWRSMECFVHFLTSGLFGEGWLIISPWLRLAVIQVVQFRRIKRERLRLSLDQSIRHTQAAQARLHWGQVILQLCVCCYIAKYLSINDLYPPCCQCSWCEDFSRGKHNKEKGGWHRETRRTCTGWQWRFWKHFQTLTFKLFCTLMSAQNTIPDNLFVLFWLIESIHL